MATLFVKRLTTMDFSYLDPTRGLVGESWQVDIALQGGLDEQGMVVDFADVKKLTKQTIDQYFDHRLLVPRQSGALRWREAHDEVLLHFDLDDGSHITHRSPRGAVAPINSDIITPEQVATDIIATLRSSLPDNVIDIDLRLWPEDIDGAYYHYSHGLKHHCGNCQRIAHGHRSRIEIRRNGNDDSGLALAWARDWRDIYIATREDLVNEADGYSSFAYHSEQGRFELTLPTTHCYLVDDDSTVENLAQHIAGELHRRFPHDAFEVVAFEGVDKGAVGTAGQS